MCFGLPASCTAEWRLVGLLGLGGSRSAVVGVGVRSCGRSEVRRSEAFLEFSGSISRRSEILLVGALLISVRCGEYRVGCDRLGVDNGS